MPDKDDDIPVLTDAIEHASQSSERPSSRELASLEARLCASSLRLAEALLREACREAEHALMERVMNELRAELPAIVNHALREHFDK